MNMNMNMNIVVYSLGDFIMYYDTHANNKTYYGRIISIPHIDDSQDIYIKIECILEFNSLPSVLKSKQRKVASCNGHLWMTDKTLIINPINIKSKVYIWLMDISKPTNYQYSIDEIVYNINGQWTTRPIDL